MKKSRAKSQSRKEQTKKCEMIRFAKDGFLRNWDEWMIRMSG